jgi:HEPN domain-containing protein
VTACVTHVQSSQATGASVQGLLGELQGINMRLHHPYELSGVGRDEWAEIKEALYSLVDSYIGDDDVDEER